MSKARRHKASRLPTDAGLPLVLALVHAAQAHGYQPTAIFDTSRAYRIWNRDEDYPDGLRFEVVALDILKPRLCFQMQGAPENAFSFLCDWSRAYHRGEVLACPSGPDRLMGVAHEILTDAMGVILQNV